MRHNFANFTSRISQSSLVTRLRCVGKYEDFCCKFTAEFNTGRILNTVQYALKL